MSVLGSYLLAVLWNVCKWGKRYAYATTENAPKFLDTKPYTRDNRNNLSQ
jgi:hypothetical protein